MKMLNMFCPACGQDQLVAANGGYDLMCMNTSCPDRHAARKVLSDSEIHHVVRIDPMGYFNSKHPLRERVSDELLNCNIHDVVMRWVGVPTLERKREIADTVWRVKHTGNDDWEWEQLD